MIGGRGLMMRGLGLKLNKLMFVNLLRSSFFSSRPNILSCQNEVFSSKRGLLSFEITDRLVSLARLPHKTPGPVSS